MPGVSKETAQGTDAHPTTEVIPDRRIAIVPRIARQFIRLRDRVSGDAHLYNGWILLAALDELVVCELGVLVAVHVLEDLVHAL